MKAGAFAAALLLFVALPSSAGQDLPAPPSFGPDGELIIEAPSLELPANPFALVVLDGATLTLAARALPSLAFDAIVSGTESVPSGRVELTTSAATLSRDLLQADAVVFRDLPSDPDATYGIAVYGPTNNLVASLSGVKLVGLDPIFDDNTGGADGPADGCATGWTDAQRNGGVYSAYITQPNTGTTARALGSDEKKESWQYRAATSSSLGPWTTLNRAFSFGHGFYGANQFPLGAEIDLPVGASHLGSKSLSHQNPGWPCTAVEVGHDIVTSHAQIIYFDVLGPVVARHIAADPSQHGWPQQNCSTTIPTLIQNALALTKRRAWLGAVIPTKFCTTSWSVITSANGNSGLGLEAPRASHGTYEGMDGYITTRYSSAGTFKMAFGGFVQVDSYYRACMRCSAFTQSAWHGFDGSTGNGPWAQGRVV